MKASPAALLLISVLLLSFSSAQIEFVGYMTSAEGPRFALKGEKEEKASGWLALGDSYFGFKLLAHDSQRGILSVEKNGERFELPIKQARVAHADAPKSPKPKIGQIKIQFADGAAVSEQVVRDNMQLRPGDEFDPVALDKSIRSLYRTGHFKTIEFKQEPPVSGTMNLVVIVTPK